MGMTKEQLIREMIQVELLYRTKQQLKKDKLNEGAAGGSGELAKFSNKLTQVGTTTDPNSNAKPIGALSSPDEEDEDSANKSKVVQYEYILGKGCNNDYIKNLANEKFVLPFFIPDPNDSTKIKAITEYTYREFNPYAALDEVDKIWNFLKQHIYNDLKIPMAALNEIIPLLKDYEAKNNGKIFSVFEKVFPIQSITLNNHKDLNTLAKFFQEIVEKIPDPNDTTGKNLIYKAPAVNALYQKIYLNIAKDKDRAFNSGKGEYLTVLLVKGAKSGGSTDLDVQVGNFSFDIKQVTNANPDLVFTYSLKSGMSKFRENFIRIYSDLGTKIHGLSSELEKLHVDEDLIKTINEFEGYVGSSFKKGTAMYKRKYQSEKVQDLSEYISFTDISEALKQGLVSLKGRTYNNIMEFNSYINNDLNQIYNNTEYDDTILSQSLQITTDVNAPANSTTSTKISINLPTKIKNVNSKIINFFSNNYLFNLVSWKDFKNYGATQSDKINITKKQKILDENQWIPFEVAGTLLFEILNVNNYNALIDKNIDVNYSKYFKLDPKFPPIKDIVKPQKTWIDSSNKTNFNTLLTTSNIFEKNSIIYNLLDKISTDTGMGTDKMTVSKMKSVWGQIPEILSSLCDNQIILTVNDMQKLNKIIQTNNNTIQELTTTNNRLTGKYGDEYIVEPIKQDQDSGEFIIDISFYKNKVKHHIDKLYSKDFKITGSTDNKITKVNKSSKIINIQNKSNDFVKSVKIDLEDVLSDKQTIDNKLKEFNLFTSLQPKILEELFNDTVLPKSNNQVNINVKDLKLQVDKNKNLDFFNRLKSIKDELQESNFLTDLYDLYMIVQEMEEKIKDYYSDKNGVLVFVDTGAGDDAEYMQVNYWSDVIGFDKDYKEDEGFISNLYDIGILCPGKKLDLGSSKQTIKAVIKDLFETAFDLMMQVQGIIRGDK